MAISVCPFGCKGEVGEIGVLEYDGDGRRLIGLLKVFQRGEKKMLELMTSWEFLKKVACLEKH